MADRKTVYMCNGTRVGVVYTDPCKAVGSLSIGEDGRGTVALVPLTLPPRRVTVKLLKTGDSVNNVIPTMSWELVSDGNNSTPTYWIAGVRIHGLIPQACDWMISRIKSQFNTLPILTQEPVPREIPSSKDQAVPSNNISTVTTALVPGEQVWIDHDYRLTAGNGTALYQWRTIAMTGGFVVDVWPHATVLGAFTYDVEIGGTIHYNLLPTDFYPYQAGDWVFVLILISASTTQDRQALQPDTNLTGTLRIAPYNINNHGQIPSIKSYLTSDFTSWANLRVLYGTVVSSENNEATVTLTETGQQITAPIRYNCNHLLGFNHVHTAFKPGRPVMLAFDGYQTIPSALNTCVIGFQDTLQRCIEAGILVNFCQADGTLLGVERGMWVLSGTNAEQETASGGNAWWSNGVDTISWQVAGGGKHAFGNASFTSQIISGGTLLATAPRSVAGAALRPIEGGRELLVVCYDGSVWKKALTSQTATWIMLSDASILPPKTSVKFNVSATSAVSINWDYSNSSSPKGYLMEWAVAGDIVDFTYTNQYGTTATGWSMPIAVDFNGNTLETATLVYSSTTALIESIVDTSVVWGTVESNDYVEARTGEISTTAETTLQIQWPGGTELLYRQTTTEIFIGTQYNRWFYSLSYFLGGVGTTTSTLEVSRAVIEGLDLIGNHIAVYRQTFGPVITRQTTRTGLPYDSETAEPVGQTVSYNFDATVTVQRIKQLDGTAVLYGSALNCNAEYTPSESHQSANYLYPSASEDGFDAVSFYQNASVVSSWVLPIDTTALNHLSEYFHSVARSSDSLMIWRTDYSNVHAYYSGGDLETLTGLAGPLFAASATVI